MAHICFDEGVLRGLCERVCTIATPNVDGFKSTIDTVNRVKDSESVTKKLGLPEKGISNGRLGSNCG